MKRYLLNFNWALAVFAAALATAGVVFVGSAGAARQSMVLQTAWRTHAATAATGFVLMFAIATIDYRKLLDWFATPYFIVSLALLGAVLFFGSTIYGGKRWLWFFQPSETAKLALIMFFAQLFGKHGAALSGFKGFAAASAAFVPAAAMILAEPDLGTALVLAPTAAAMLFAARIWTKGLAAIVLAAVLAAGAAVGTVAAAERAGDPAEKERILSVLPLRKHQIARIRTFVNPDADPYGGGWNLRQARISIGSGGFSGKGIGKGDAKFLGYLPPSVSMNDFIFAVLAEETGFKGSIAVIALFAAMFLCCAYSALRCRNDRGRLLAIGIATLLFSHAYVNIAMSIGLMPITGLPLPFISAGRTFLVTAFVALGLVESVAVHGRENAESGRKGFAAPAE